MANPQYAKTEVHLLAGVPFNSSYENVRLFNSVDEQYNYFNSFIKYNESNVSYQRVASNAFRSSLKFEEVSLCNYIRFRNSGVDDKWYYGFITDVQFVAPDTTIVYYKLDVFQSFIFNVTIQDSYIDRKHQARWQSNGLPYYYVQEENLDYGTEYTVASRQQYSELPGVVFAVVVSVVDLVQNGNVYGGTRINGVSQPYFYYIIPCQTSTTSATPTVNGQAISDLDTLYNRITSNENLAGKVINIYFMAFTGMGFSNNPAGSQNFFSSFVDVVSGNGLSMAKVVSGQRLNDVRINIGPKYEGFESYVAGPYDESRLLNYPYAFTELIDYNGHSFIIKNEYIRGGTTSRLNLVIQAKVSLGPQPKVGFSVLNYNVGETSFLDGDLEYAIIDNSPNDLPIIDDYTAAYLQGNKNAIQTQLNHAQENANVFRGRNLQNLDFNNANTLLNGQIGSVGTLLGVASNRLQAGYNSADYVRNYQQQVEAINSKLSDISNIPPSVNQMGGNVIFNIQNGIYGFTIKKMIIKVQYLNTLRSYFKIYGYKYNMVGKPLEQTRQTWDYVKTVGVNIKANERIQDSYLQELRRIFDTGVALWHNNDVGNYALSNNDVGTP